jgi:hypothetical protein
MPDLEHKFEALESQLSTQHTAISNAMDSILTALGAPPPTATVTLADISNQLSSLNDSLAAIVTEQRAFYSSNLDVLGLINTNLDTMLNNNSLNTQRLLIAIAANDPCKSCDVLPIEPPPLDVTPQTVDEDHCKRMQALIYALERLTVKLDVLSSFGLGFSPTVIRDAIAEVTTELGVTELLQYPSLGEVAQLAGAGAAYVVSNIFSSNSLPANFLSIKDQLLVVLYDTDSASAGQSAYRSFLEGSGLPSAVVQLFKAMAYTSLFNLYYDNTAMLDLSGYDGTICAPAVEGVLGITECTVFEAVPITAGDSLYYVITAGEMGGSSNLYMQGDFYGYSFQQVTGVEGRATMLYLQDAENPTGHWNSFHGPGEDMSTINVHTTGIALLTADTNSMAFPFTARFCPPT